MGSFEDVGCNTGLNLGLGFSTTSTAVPTPSKPNSSSGGGMNQTAAMETKLTLSLSGGHRDEINHNRSQNQNQNQNQNSHHHHQLLMYRQVSPQSHGSAVSSYSSGRVKRERDQSSTDDQDVEVERMVSSRVSDEDEDGGVNARKKLRLTKEQSALLEESFKQHSTLNPKQKQALARQLNLRPRQVEVWFQNRRARTKLKQTEVDCEFLKKCCETLTDENRRLQKEVQELKALKLAQPFYMHMPAATLTMCPSCERIGGGGDGSSKVPFPMVPKPGHCFNPFTNPSAAC